MLDVAAPGARADQHAGHAAAEAAVVAQRFLRGGHRRERRLDVVVETAPFVVVDDHQRARPLRARAQHVVDLVEEVLAVAHVGVGMVVARDAAALLELGADVVDIGQVGQRAGGDVGGEAAHVVLLGEPAVLAAPVRGVGHVHVVIGHAALRGQHGVPDRRQGRDRHAVLDAVGLAGVHVEAVRRGRAEDAAEVAIADGPVRGAALEERQAVGGVVADGEGIARRLRQQKAVHLAAVDLLAPAGVAVVRVGEQAVLVVRREIVGGVAVARRVLENQPGLDAVGAGHPAEVVIEGAVLHHHHHDVIDARVLRRRQACGTAAAAGLRRTAAAAALQQGPAGDTGDAADEAPTAVIDRSGALVVIALAGTHRWSPPPETAPVLQNCDSYVTRACFGLSNTATVGAAAASRPFPRI